MTRKIVQIAADPSYLYALCDDGEIFRLDADIHSTWYNRNAGPPIVDMWDHSETWVAEPW